MNIKAYRRKNGSIGIRNHLLILPISICPSTIAARISQNIKNAVAVYHQHVICEAGEDQKQTLRTLINFGNNPNVGAVLLIGLGNEGIFLEQLPEAIKNSGKRAELITIKECGGTIKTIAKGTEIALSMAQQLSTMEREEVDLDRLVVGLKCGGTDYSSEIAANPAVGAAADVVVSKGGAVLMTETTEIIGAEHILAKRAVNDQAAEKLIAKVKKFEKNAASLGINLRGVNPTEGNIKSGITTIEEKSICAIHKSGKAPLQDVIEYAEPVPGKGFYFMDGPGHDVDSLTGMIAGGAHLILFTSGRGTPIGSAVAPIIKITGNHRSFELMSDIFDFDASPILDDGAPEGKIGESLFQEIISVCNGKLTKSEVLKNNEFGIYRIGPTF
jgi:altronate dehydratase large subunit